MPLPSLATTDDLADWLGVTIEDDDDRAEAVLRHASTAVRVEAGANWMNSTGDALEGVPFGIPEIVVQVAARMWVNPSGATSQTTGPFSAEFTGLELTDGEKAAIARAISTAGGAGAVTGLWTLQTTREDFETDTIYLPTTPDGGTIPAFDRSMY